MNLLAIRLSAMGDTALVVPALNAVLQQHPDVTITMLTRPAFTPLFKNMERVQCIAADVKSKHKGVPGLYRLYKEIKKQQKPGKIIDLHDVMRSWVLCSFFKKDGIPYFRIDKGRKEKKALTRKEDKKFVQLKHSVNRYLDVFAKAGFPAQLTYNSSGFNAAEVPHEFLKEHNLFPKNKLWVGIAPFAKHVEKIWPLSKMELVIQDLIQKNYQLFLFGGKEESAAFEKLKQRFPEIFIIAGKLSLTKELVLIKHLDLMISMDSANMHLAAISGIPVVSVWGATHSFAGFGPLNGNEKYIVQIPHAELSCRPCSVFGNKPCFRSDHACMEWISVERIMDKIDEVLNL
jgi:ADP-heptose:LPS heptosyltransferase